MNNLEHKHRTFQQTHSSYLRQNPKVNTQNTFIQEIYHRWFEKYLYYISFFFFGFDYIGCIVNMNTIQMQASMFILFRFYNTLSVQPL